MRSPVIIRRSGFGLRLSFGIASQRYSVARLACGMVAPVLASHDRSGCARPSTHGGNRGRRRLDELDDAVEVDGLDQVLVEARGCRTAAVRGLAVSGDRDQPDPGQRGV